MHILLCLHFCTTYHFQGKIHLMPVSCLQELHVTFYLSYWIMPFSVKYKSVGRPFIRLQMPAQYVLGATDGTWWGMLRSWCENMAQLMLLSKLGICISMPDFIFSWSPLQCLLLELLGLLCAILPSCPAIPPLPFRLFSLFGFPVMAMLAQWQTQPLLHPLALLECKSRWQGWKYKTSWWVWYKCLKWICTSGHYSLWNQQNIFNALESVRHQSKYTAMTCLVQSFVQNWYEPQQSNVVFIFYFPWQTCWVNRVMAK